MFPLTDCPQSDRAQWSFRLFGTPVRVTLWFWITTLILGADRGVLGAAIWIAVCFVSILLHEFGHVFAYRYFNRRAEVVLYGFGGLAIPSHDVQGSFADVVVSFAGPFAGFCLAALTAALVVLTGGRIFTGWHLFLPHASAMLNPRFVASSHDYLLYSRATMLVNDLLFVNFYWGLVNLLPVWPLDGGHISRALLKHWDPYDGVRKSLILSAVIAAVVGLAALTDQNTWVAIMFGIFAVSSLQSIEGERRRPIQAYRRWRD